MKKKFIFKVREVWNTEVIVEADSQDDARVKLKNFIENGDQDIHEIVGSSVRDGIYISEDDVVESRNKKLEPHF